MPKTGAISADIILWGLTHRVRCGHWRRSISQKPNPFGDYSVNWGGKDWISRDAAISAGMQTISAPKVLTPTELRDVLTQRIFSGPGPLTQGDVAGLAALQNGASPDRALAWQALGNATQDLMVGFSVGRASGGSRVGPNSRYPTMELSLGRAAEITGVDLSLTYKPGWSAAQRAEADLKVQILTEGDTVVSSASRSGTSAASRYRRAGNDIPVGNDVDHAIDLQLGGSDTVSNMWLLNSSVNRSLGSQIQQRIKNLPPGTVVNKVTGGDR